jgi:hypothetical protein
VGLIIANTRRNVVYRGLSIDPNRWFSREGALANLRHLNPQAPAKQIDNLLEVLDRERPTLLGFIEPRHGGLLVALHNNGPAYSVEDELALSDRMHLADRAQPHEFFLCTHEADFEALASGPYNAVLQQAPPPPDDGSLSRYAAAHRWRYVNLEVTHGLLDRQVAMLDWLVRTLPEAR